MREYSYDAATEMLKGFPKIKKLGAVSPNGEATPFVWSGGLMRLENRDPSKCYSSEANIVALIRDCETGEVIFRFGGECIFYALYVEDGVAYVTGVKRDSTDTILLQESRDLIHWTEPRVLLKNPGWAYCNTALTKGPDGYVLLMEADSRGASDEVAGYVGQFYTYFFATSKDLVEWTHLDPTRYCYDPGRYNGGPWMRWSNGWFYVIGVVEIPGPIYTNCCCRTKDFEHWYMGKYNPILVPDEDDRIISDKCFDMSDAFLEEIKTAYLSSNADIDMCDWEGKTRMVYVVGNQLGFYYQAEAEYDGTVAGFLAHQFDE